MDAKMNNKVLRSLFKAWNTINTIIHPFEMIHDINTLKFRKFMRMLKNAEIKLKAQWQSEIVEASNARIKGLALKGTSDESSSNESESQDNEEEGVGLIARRPFKSEKKKFIKKKS